MTGATFHKSGIEVDRRPRCQSLHQVHAGHHTYTLRCDQHAGHDGEHEAYYGWTGRPEVWS